MKLPEQQKFTIPELAGRWKETENQILDMAAAGHLELRAQFFGCFAQYLTTDDHTFFKDGERLNSLDFRLTDPNFIHEIVKHGAIEKQFIRTKVDGKECDIFFYPGASEHPYREVRYPIIIRQQDLYVPLSSVFKVEEQSMQRLVLEEMLARLNEYGETSEKFAEWLTEKHPAIGKTLAKRIFTFLNLKDL